MKKIKKLSYKEYYTKNAEVVQHEYYDANSMAIKTVSIKCYVDTAEVRKAGFKKIILTMLRQGKLAL